MQELNFDCDSVGCSDCSSWVWSGEGLLDPFPLILSHREAAQDDIDYFNSDARREDTKRARLSETSVVVSPTPAQLFEQTSVGVHT